MLAVFQDDMILKCSMKHQYTPFLIEANVVAWQLF